MLEENLRLYKILLFQLFNELRGLHSNKCMYSLKILTLNSSFVPT